MCVRQKAQSRQERGQAADSASGGFSAKPALTVRLSLTVSKCSALAGNTCRWARPLHNDCTLRQEGDLSNES